MLALAACAAPSNGSHGAGGGGKGDGTSGCELDAERSLFVRDPSVVESSDARGQGPLAFATVLRNVFSENASAEDEWLHANGDGLCRLPATFGISCTPALPYRLLDVATVPADLVAIVNRVDLDGLGLPPELRMVYQLPDRFFANHEDELTRKFVNFELDLSAVRDEHGQPISTEDWAQRFAALSDHPIDSVEYREALEDIVTLVTRRGAAPGHPNGSALVRIQTSAEGWNYGHRLDEWDIVSLGLDDTGHLVGKDLDKVPGHAGQNAESLADILMDHESEVLAGTFDLPPYKYDPFNPNAPLTRANFALAVTWGSGLLDADYGQTLPYSSLPLRAGWTAQRFERVRSTFQSQGCVACHGGATATSGNQIEPKVPGQRVARSGFLDHVEMPRRMTRLRELACDTSADVLALEDNRRFVGCTQVTACDASTPTSVVLNEVRTTAAMGGFIELAGPPGLALDGYSINFQSNTILLDGYRIGSNGYFVVADDSTVNIAPDSGFKILFFRPLIDGTNAIQLQQGTTLIDALAFGPPSTDPYALRGEGTRAATASDAWSSLARSEASADTGDNASDFTAMMPTPGLPNCSCQ